LQCYICNYNVTLAEFLGGVAILLIVCLSGRLSHSYTLLRLLDGMRFQLARKLVWSQVTLC